MKKLILPFLLTFLIPVKAQETRNDVLQALENNQKLNSTETATLTTASRLFKDRDDLTSVIVVIPSGAIVNVTGRDDEFLYVIFEGDEGYINASHARINKPAVAVQPATQEIADRSTVPPPRMTRLGYLENKYGIRTGRRINEGKIWKGMSAEMVKDSWGSPQKITRNISGNIIKEEWFYKNTWLYIQNSVLAEWGPVK